MAVVLSTIKGSPALSEIDEMAIRKGEIDQNPDLLDNQAFKLQKILNEEKRKAELNRLSKEIELKNLEYRQLVSENNGNPVTINITIQPGDHMKEELYEGRLKKLQDTSERLDYLIQRQSTGVMYHPNEPKSLC